jgi:hypothetical protein
MSTLHEDKYTFISHYVLLRMRNVSDKSCREIWNTHFTFNNYFQKSYHLWGNVETYCTAIQVTDDDMTQVHSILVTLSYKRTLRVCNNYCFSNATMVAQMHLNVMLYVYCLSCCFFWSHNSLDLSFTGFHSIFIEYLPKVKQKLKHVRCTIHTGTVPTLI